MPATETSERIPGHTLLDGGHVHEYDVVGGTEFAGGCLCGAKPPGFPEVTIAQMREWHLGHKASVRRRQSR